MSRLLWGVCGSVLCGAVSFAERLFLARSWSSLSQGAERAGLGLDWPPCGTELRDLIGEPYYFDIRSRLRHSERPLLFVVLVLLLCVLRCVHFAFEPRDGIGNI